MPFDCFDHNMIYNRSYVAELAAVRIDGSEEKMMADYKETKGIFAGVNNAQIYYKSWKAENPRGVIVIAHGLGEHSGRYENLICIMQDDDISFYALDHRGHGLSEGKRGHISSFSEYTEDLKTLIKVVKKENQSMPIILLGHSMGGVIACQYALKYPQDISGLILSSAGLIPAGELPVWKKMLAGFLSKTAPALAMSNGLKSSDLSHDQAVVDAYVNDPLVHDRVSSRWFMEFVRAGADSLRRAAELTMPLLVIHGADDRIVDLRGSKEVIKNASSLDKQFYLFEGLYHETMNEASPEREKVINSIREWILKQIEVRPNNQQQ